LPVVRCQDCERPVLQSAILNHAGSSRLRPDSHPRRVGVDQGDPLTPAACPGHFLLAAKCLKVRQLEQAGAQGEDDDGRSLSVSLKPNKRRLSNGASLSFARPSRHLCARLTISDWSDALDVCCIASLSSTSSPPTAKRSKYDPPSPAPSTASRSVAAESDYGGSTSAIEGLSKEAWAQRREYEKRLLKEAQRAEKKGERRASCLALRRSRPPHSVMTDRLTTVLFSLADAPLDLNRHCGVINAKGVPCSRALTCKSHSVGAKRDVPGRSKPYDVLFAEWNAVHKPHLAAKQKESKLRRELDKSPSEAAGTPKAGGAAGEPSAGKKKKSGANAGGSGKKGKSSSSSSVNVGAAGAGADTNGSSTPGSELAWLISAAQASRARLAAAPSRRLTTVLAKGGGNSVAAPPPTAIPPALLAPPSGSNASGGRKPSAAQMRQLGPRIFPREASKTLLYGRRREESATLNGLLREALIGDAR
jgi:hypothetical protein